MQIKKGDRGNEVVDIQRRLSALGYDLGPTVVDGAFEGKTEAAVKSFQRKYNLLADGIVNTATWRSLVDATYRLSDRALYLRLPFFHGQDVFQLQQWLNTIGFHPEVVDGIFGASTERAVREFQDNFGLFPDGIVGPSTLAALFNLRHMLDKDGDAAYPKQPPSSFVSHIKGKKIAVGCHRLEARTWRNLPEESGWLYIDLAHRFSNLLELLGAEIQLFKPDEELSTENEVAVSFISGKDHESGDIIIVNHAQDEKSERLAVFVADELISSLKDNVKKVEVRPANTFPPGGPRIAILVDELAAIKGETQLKKDIVKQKIASAIFDGLKKYFETSSC